MSDTQEAPVTMPSVHGYSGEMTNVTVIKALTFTHQDTQTENFQPGTYDVPVEVAKHFFFAHHTSNPPPSEPMPGTTEFVLKQQEMMKQAAQVNQAAAVRNAQEREANASINRAALEEATRKQLTDQLTPVIQDELRVGLYASIREELLVNIRAEIEAEMAAESVGTVAEAETNIRKKRVG